MHQKVREQTARRAFNRQSMSPQRYEVDFMPFVHSIDVGTKIYEQLCNFIIEVLYPTANVYTILAYKSATWAYRRTSSR